MTSVFTCTICPTPMLPSLQQLKDGVQGFYLYLVPHGRPRRFVPLWKKVCSKANVYIISPCATKAKVHDYSGYVVANPHLQHSRNLCPAAHLDTSMMMTMMNTKLLASLQCWWNKLPQMNASKTCVLFLSLKEFYVSFRNPSPEPCHLVPDRLADELQNQVILPVIFFANLCKYCFPCPLRRRQKLHLRLSSAPEILRELTQHPSIRGPIYGRPSNS